MAKILDSEGNEVGSEVTEEEKGEEPSAEEMSVPEGEVTPPKRIHVITPPARPPRSITVLIDQDRLGFGMLGDVSVEDMRGAAAGLMKAAEHAVQQQAAQAKAKFDAQFKKNMPSRRTV